MSYLKYYQKENEEYPIENKKWYCEEEQIKKLVKNFCAQYLVPKDKFNPNSIVWNKKNNSGHIAGGPSRMTLHLPRCRTCSIGLLMHELGHILEFVKYGKAGHNNKHKRQMKSLIGWCRREEYFRKYCYVNPDYTPPEKEAKKEKEQEVIDTLLPKLKAALNQMEKQK